MLLSIFFSQIKHCHFVAGWFNTIFYFDIFQRSLTNTTITTNITSNTMFRCKAMSRLILLHPSIISKVIVIEAQHNALMQWIAIELRTPGILQWIFQILQWHPKTGKLCQCLVSNIITVHYTYIYRKKYILLFIFFYKNKPLKVNAIAKGQNMLIQLHSLGHFDNLKLSHLEI